jgi:predicted amidohydrolase YtcJ
VLKDKTKWIRGGGWDHTSWPSGKLPSAVSLPPSHTYHPLHLIYISKCQADLDSDPVIKGRPVVLQSKDCHALWVTLEAMKNSLPFADEVDGGVVLKDAQGNPSG